MIMNKETRLRQLEKRLLQQREQLEEIELYYGCGTKYHNKKMAIEETEWLIRYYQKTIAEENRRLEESKKYDYCRKIQCEFYVGGGGCFAKKIPESNSCKFLEYDNE